MLLDMLGGIIVIVMTVTIIGSIFLEVIKPE